MTSRVINRAAMFSLNISQCLVQCHIAAHPLARCTAVQAVRLLRRAVHLPLRVLLPTVPVRPERGPRGEQRLRSELPGARHVVLRTF